MPAFIPGTPVLLSLLLEDSVTTKHPRAEVYAGAAAVTNVNLSHIGGGRYVGTWVPINAVDYDIVFRVYDDAAHTLLSPNYTAESERWQPGQAFQDASLSSAVADAVWDENLSAHALAGSTGEALSRLTLARSLAIDNTADWSRLILQILRNRLELADGSTDNWVLYDDDDTTPLLRWSVRDKAGNAILQPLSAPSRRTRGV